MFFTIGMVGAIAAAALLLLAALISFFSSSCLNALHHAYACLQVVSNLAAAAGFYGFCFHAGRIYDAVASHPLQSNASNYQVIHAFAAAILLLTLVYPIFIWRSGDFTPEADDDLSPSLTVPYGKLVGGP